MLKVLAVLAHVFVHRIGLAIVRTIATRKRSSAGGFLLGGLCCLASSIALAEGLPTVGGCPAIEYPPAREAGAPLRVDGLTIKDASGRVVLLRGVNATGDAKQPPFTPLSRPQLLDPLPRIGVNTLRLLFIWEAMEPTRCEYNDAYMAYYERVVQWAEERGLYVLVDFHQDAFSRFILGGCGEGFPQWTTTDIGQSTPDNSPGCSAWDFSMVLSPLHHRAWENFHEDKGGIRSRYVEMTKYVADRLAKHRNVIGYDLINEPWGDNEQLGTLFREVGDAIRERHPGAILFVPAHPLVGAGIFANTMQRPPFDNMVYSPHYYDPATYFLKVWLGNTPSWLLDNIQQTASAWKVPMFLSEFGAPGTARDAGNYMEATYQWLDTKFVSSTQWNYTPAWTETNKDGWNAEDFSIVDDKGKLRGALFTPRPYPEKTAGQPQSFKRGEHGFTYSWLQNPALGSTELFIPEHYLDGKKMIVQADSTLGASCDINGERLTCTSDKPGPVVVSISTVEPMDNSRDESIGVEPPRWPTPAPLSGRVTLR